jgi:hypothetical protein
MYGYGYSLYNRLAFLGGLDSDATAFFSATGITDPTIQGAINSLCVDLKTYGVWDKMKAIYPFVGGTANTHSYNLVNTALHQITWFGGLTHDANGVTPNGTNGYGNLNFNPRTHLGAQSSMGTYIRVNNTLSGKVDYGSSNLDGFQNACLIASFGNLIYFQNIGGVNNITTPNATTNAFFHTGVDTSNNIFAYKNNTLMLSKTPAVIGTPPNVNTTLFAYNAGGVGSFSPRPSSFFFAGSGITQEDNGNIYYCIQKFQTTLGRQVGTPIYSSNATDVNARLFLGATNIQDATITSAVDTLVQGLKTDGVWSKLKAVYPFVGGTATTHKFNLANALDEDTSFRLAFSGGWTHANTGATPNGTNGFANTFFNPSLNLTASSSHVTFYSRTNFAPASPADKCFYGVLKTSNYFIADLYLSNYTTAYTHSGSFTYNALNTGSTGLIMVKNIGGTQKFLRNNVTIHTSNPSGGYANDNIYLNALNLNGTSVTNYSPYQCAFASFGDGLTDTEASNLYTRVQAFQTTLNRQV